MGLLDWLRGYTPPTSRVVMIVSIGDLIAGETYDLPVEQADEYVVKRYAQGDLSRPFSQDEVSHITRLDQSVGV